MHCPERRPGLLICLLSLYDMCIWTDTYHPGQQALRWRALEQEFGTNQPDCRFVGSRADEAARILTLPDGVKAGLYLRPRKGALVYLTNLLKTPQTVALDFRLADLGLPQYSVTDLESGEEVTGTPLTVAGHDFRLVAVTPK